MTPATAVAEEPPRTADAAPPPAAGGPRAGLGVGTTVLALLAWIALVATVHVSQGTAAVHSGDLWSWLLGRADPQASAVIEASRLPRLAAGLVVGAALGTAGTVMQSFSRNLLASPDTLAVNQGAYLALTVAAVLGLAGTVAGQLATALVGGLLGAVLVLALAGAAYGTVRLILAGITVGLVCTSATTALIITHPYESRGLFAWSAGSLGQSTTSGLVGLTPVVVVAVLGVLVLGRRLDLLRLGDDEAASLGVPVRRTQRQLLVLSVGLAAVAVTLAGPIGYVGLVAPTLVRLLSRVVPGLHRHRLLVPVAALAGVALLLTADVAVRAVVGAQAAVQVPTGVATSLLGGGFLVVLAVRLRAQGFGSATSDLDVRGTGARRFLAVVAVAAVVLVLCVVLAALLGDRVLLPGDLGVWASGNAGPIVSGVMDTRLPRVLAALLAGAALAAAGTLVQGVTRNPLADTGVIGITGGGAVLGVLVVTFAPDAGFWTLAGAAVLGAVLAGAVVFGFAARTGFATDRLLLIGLGLGIATDAVTTTVIVATDPFGQAKALTWLSGSTYGRVYGHLVPLLLGCLVLVPLASLWARRLDLLSVDEDTPVLLGIDVPRVRFGLLAVAVLLTGLSVAAIGPIAFVGLVAPHAARSLVGRRHTRVVPVAALLGATVVVLSDLVGRSVLAPVQLPASLLTAAIGAPYFLWLMYRTGIR
ncbi:iron-hydroxamate transporter permease subunit [Marmoricola endophyticus]|uniref:Iron-hydroxamate transporter permease subunit n=1 Tax=Marmoricola endophyticus TaxID=2040280 RepID=A0A917BU04_9ACTN|nr:iron ABC transporter permease [Marmoricola endophyticus]GGF57351.1 iron-hydroxamate transporter permease subunit [Marmoricola endophyticus]